MVFFSEKWLFIELELRSEIQGSNEPCGQTSSGEANNVTHPKKTRFCFNMYIVDWEEFYEAASKLFQASPNVSFNSDFILFWPFLVSIFDQIQTQGRKNCLQNNEWCCGKLTNPSSFQTNFFSVSNTGLTNKRLSNKWKSWIIF